MSLISSVSAILSERVTDLDKIVYFPNAMSSSEDDLAILDVDWKNIIPDPPKNSSTTTAKEMKAVYEATKSRTQKEIELIHTVDVEPLVLFEKALSKYDIVFPKNIFDEYYNILEQYMYALKNHYNRARPEQLSPYFNIDIDILYTETHHTPAYPSGHTMYAALAAHIISDRYPERKKEMFDLAKYCGLARILQGVHYPSDNDAAFKATSVLYQAIKRRFEDEERNQNFPTNKQPKTS